MPKKDQNNTKPKKENEEELKQKWEEELDLKTKRDDAYFENVEKRVADTKGIYKEYDTNRYTKKAQMSQLIATWREELKDDKEVLKDETLAKLLKDVEAYAAMDVTATHSATVGNVDKVRRSYRKVGNSVKAESKQISNIAQNVQKYIEELESRADEFVDEEQEKLFTRRQIMAQNIQLLMEEQMNGYMPEVTEGAQHIKAKDDAIKTLDKNKFVDKRDMPLFPHDPSPSDISQGVIGDCYMVAVLANIAKTNPDKIKEAMRDNGDGTVTVRLYQSVIPKDVDYFAKNATPPTKMEPFYVTVDKSVPPDTATQNCLWAAMIEKAVVASGLTKDRRFSGTYARPVPPNIDELYEKYKNMREDLRPSKIECPWLFDKNNNLVKWQADYAQIEGGDSEVFTETFMGEGYEAVKYENTNIRENAARDLAYDFIMAQVGKISNAAYEEKARKILESQGNAAQRLKNASCLLRGLTLGHVSHNYYTPTFTEKGALKSLDEVSYDTDNCFYAFADTIASAVAPLLYEGSVRYDKSDFITEATKAIKDKFNLTKDKYTDEFNKKSLDKLMEEFEQNKKEIFSGISGEKYPLSYNKVFEEIKHELSEGRIVAAATPAAPEGDVKVKGGLNYTHAYNVLGTEEQEIDGKHYKFLVVRNPHGSERVPVYDYSIVPPKAITGYEASSQGIFKMELSHFISNMEYFTVNGKNMTKEEKESSDKKKISYIQQQLLGKYDRVFTEVDKNLQRALIEDPDNAEHINKIRERITTQFLAKEDKLIDRDNYQPFKVFANEMLDKEGINFKPATRRIIEAAAEFAEMNHFDIEDPMAEIMKKMIRLPKGKTKKDSVDLQEKDKLPNVIVLSKEAKEYLDKKQRMLKKQENFETQKQNLKNVMDNLLKEKGYKAEEIKSLISDYENEKMEIRDCSDKLRRCADDREQAERNIPDSNAEIDKAKKNIDNFHEKNKEKDAAAKKLKECLINLENKLEQEGGKEPLIQKRKEELKVEMQAKETAWVNDKKNFLRSLEYTLKNNQEAMKYIHHKLDMIENPPTEEDFFDSDVLEELNDERFVSFIEKRIDDISKKYTDYSAKKEELEEFERNPESKEVFPLEWIKESFVFEKGEYNPLSDAPIDQYVSRAKNYVSQVDNEYSKRAGELEALQKKHANAVKE